EGEQCAPAAGETRHEGEQERSQARADVVRDPENPLRAPAMERRHLLRGGDGDGGERRLLERPRERLPEDEGADRDRRRRPGPEGGVAGEAGEEEPAAAEAVRERPEEEDAESAGGDDGEGVGERRGVRGERRADVVERDGEDGAAVALEGERDGEQAEETSVGAVHGRLVAGSRGRRQRWTLARRGCREAPRGEGRTMRGWAAGAAAVGLVFAAC